MKKIILLIVAVILLALAIIGGLAMFDMGPFASLLKGAKKTETAATPPSPPPVVNKMFDLGTYIIPLVEQRAIRRQVGLDLNIVVDPAAAEKVSQEMPRLQNVLLQDLYDFMPTHADTHSEVNKEVVHQHLIKVANGFVGDNRVRDVIIKSFYDR